MKKKGIGFRVWGLGFGVWGVGIYPRVVLLFKRSVFRKQTTKAHYNWRRIICTIYISIYT